MGMCARVVGRVCACVCVNVCMHRRMGDHTHTRARTHTHTHKLHGERMALGLQEVLEIISMDSKEIVSLGSDSMSEERERKQQRERASERCLVFNTS